MPYWEEKKVRCGCLKAFKEMLGKTMAGCAWGIIAPLTLQTENLVKCDTERLVERDQSGNRMNSQRECEESLALFAIINSILTQLEGKLRVTDQKSCGYDRRTVILFPLQILFHFNSYIQVLIEVSCVFGPSVCWQNKASFDLWYLEIY